MTRACRACGVALPEASLLSYAGMPALSQHLPEASERAGVDLRLKECSCCGLLQLDGEPVPYFREVIRAVGVSAEMRAFRLVQFREWLERSGLDGKRVLECGCGRGEYLSLMCEAGALGFGAEGSPENAAAARAAGLAVENSYFEQGGERLSAAPFDGFFILNYLEHIPNLRRYLAGIRANLAPGARGLVEVPNFDMMARARLFAEFTIDHLYYFTAVTLARVLETNGFEILSCRPVWHDYILSCEVQLRAGFDPGPFRAAEHELSASLEAFLGRFARGEVAVWGAGHQSFAVLAWAHLGDRVACVIDSAVFKQGKFAPASGLPIVAPSVLERAPLKAVLVMAGSYSEEIAFGIRAKYGERFQIAVLSGNSVEVF